MTQIISGNNSYMREILFLFILYLTLIISFFFGENSTGGAIIDYNSQIFNITVVIYVSRCSEGLKKNAS